MMKITIKPENRYYELLILKDRRMFIVDPIVVDYAINFLRVDATSCELYQLPDDLDTANLSNLTNMDVVVTTIITLNKQEIPHSYVYPACMNNPIDVLDSMPKLENHCEAFAAHAHKGALTRAVSEPLANEGFIVTSVSVGNDCITAIGNGFHITLMIHATNVSITATTTRLTNDYVFHCSIADFKFVLAELVRRYTSNQSSLNRLPYAVQLGLMSTPQDAKWHPEGCVKNHANLMIWASGLDNDLVVASIFHDLGKLDTTEWNMKKGKWTAYGHEDLAKHYINSYGRCLSHIEYNEECVKYICENHMRIGNLKDMAPKKREALGDSPYFDKLQMFHLIDGIDIEH